MVPVKNMNFRYQLNWPKVTLACLASAALLCSALASFPPYVKKHLYAAHDIRGSRAPKIEVTEWLSGGAPKTAGKTVLVDLWATWCSSCKGLIPELNHWSTKFKDRLVVVGISDEDPKVVRQFLATESMNYHVGVDPKQRLLSKLGVEGIPHVLVISPDGIVRWQGYPGEDADKLTDQKLAAIIQSGHKPRR